MKHFFLLAFPVAALLFACEAPDSTCGEIDDLEPTGCSASELAAVERAGVWHGRTVSADGGTSLVTFVSFKNPDQPRIDGTPAVTSDFDGDFFFSTDFVSNNRTIRTSLKGCHAPDPATLSGAYQRCENGRRALDGTFELKRLTRREGEAEGQGLERVGEARITQGEPVDVWVEGSYAYVSTGTGGMSIFDISDPTAPQLLSQFGAEGQYWYQARAHNGVLYVATSEGISYYDIAANPGAPGTPIGRQPIQREHLHTLHIDSAANRMVASSATTGEVILFNIANPRSPLLVSRFLVGNPDGINGLFPRASVLDGDRLYSAYGSVGVVATSIIVPSAPSQLGDAVPPLAPSRFTNALEAITVGDGRWAFEIGLGWNGHLRALDMSAPSAAVPAGEYVTRPEVSAGRVDRVGTKLYLAYHQDGVRVLDVANPAAPVQVAYFNAWTDEAAGRGSSFFEGVSAVHKARDGSAYVYAVENERGLLILRETP